ncbi:flavin-dependent oxidoreductase [Sulfitobacter aestuariivivens]|uniref:flavin-dependent oxidoreductase n=1 Tax=Sulfitobacter aestuariivivens TaxID=2766981 RepID=UPI00361754EA
MPFTVLESVTELRPLGVGINVQPNAVRELLDLGFTREDLDSAGVPTCEWALVGRGGQEIYAEPRGTFAGYNWPQYSMHRGKFQMLLAAKLKERAGEDAIMLGTRVVGYEKSTSGVTAHITRADGSADIIKGSLLIGADGIHSKVRATMHPNQPPLHWGGAILWRGTTRAKPMRTASSFVGLGTVKQRMIIYPISAPDPTDGLAQINWIAEITIDDPSARDNVGWFRQVEVADFAHHFDDWTFDWLDVPKLLHGAEVTYESAMIDRDPVPTWVDGPVALMGDAAHAMYPTGSNGASQAIIDAREIGVAMLEHGIKPDALEAYNAKLCGPVSELILRNRGHGPFGLLTIVEERCGGAFSNIDDVVSPQERSEFMAKYKAAAGFAMETLNSAPPTIPAGARIS